MRASNTIYEKFRSALFAFRNASALQQWSTYIDQQWSNRSPILGHRINEATALTIPTVLACTKIIAETVGTLPCTLRQPTRGGGWSPAVKEEEYDLLRHSPNDSDTACDFFENYITSIILRGDGFAWTPRNNRGRVQSIWPIRNDHVTVRVIDGVITYTTSAVTGAPTVLFNGGDMLHTKAFSRDGVRGSSLIHQAGELFGQSLGQSEFSSGIYKNGATIRGVVATDTPLKQEQMDYIKEKLKEDYQGSANAGKFMFLPYNMKFQPITMTPEDAQMIETIKMTERQVAALFGIPMHMLQILEKGTFNTVEQQGAEFIQLCLRKWCIRLEQSFNARLLNSGQRGRGLEFKFELDDLLRGSTADRTLYYTAMLNGGVFTRNEVRILEGKNPIDGLDEVLTPLNYTTTPEPSDDVSVDPDQDTTVEGDNQPKKVAPAKQPLAIAPAKKKPIQKKSGLNVAEEVLAEAIEKIFRKEQIVHEKLEGLDETDRRKELDKFYRTHRRYCAQNLERPLKRVHHLNGADFDARHLDAAASQVSQWFAASLAQNDGLVVFDELVNGARDAVLQTVGVDLCQV